MTTLPAPIADEAELRAVLARFAPMINADSTQQMNVALAAIAQRGMPVGDDDFNTLTATDEQDLLIKLHTRIAALLKDVPDGASLQELGQAAQPIMPLMQAVTEAMLVEALSGKGDWPKTFSV